MCVFVRACVRLCLCVCEQRQALFGVEGSFSSPNLDLPNNSRKLMNRKGRESLLLSLVPQSLQLCDLSWLSFSALCLFGAVFMFGHIGKRHLCLFNCYLSHHVM